MKKYFIIFGFVLTCLLSLTAKADLFDELAQAFRNKNISPIVQNLATVVELKFEANTNSYSHTQAEHVLREFITNNTIKNVTIMHRGKSKQGGQYVIYLLETAKGNYRTFVYSRDFNGKQLIVEMGFEKE